MIRRSKKIINMVGKLLNDSMVSLPAVDVERIAEQLNIQVRREDLKDISGFIYRDGNQVIIGLNKRGGNNRQRFTIAHELGHFFLHTQNPLFIDSGIDKGSTIRLRNQVSSEAVSLEEIEANAFAAELLMPTHMVAEEIRQLHNGSDSENDDLDKVISQMATRFKVSRQAMTIRLSNLGLFQD